MKVIFCKNKGFESLSSAARELGLNQASISAASGRSKNYFKDSPFYVSRTPLMYSPIHERSTPLEDRGDSSSVVDAIWGVLKHEVSKEELKTALQSPSFKTTSFRVQHPFRDEYINSTGIKNIAQVIPSILSHILTARASKPREQWEVSYEGKPTYNVNGIATDVLNVKPNTLKRRLHALQDTEGEYKGISCSPVWRRSVDMGTSTNFNDLLWDIDRIRIALKVYDVLKFEMSYTAIMEKLESLNYPIHNAVVSGVFKRPYSDTKIKDFADLVTKLVGVQPQRQMIAPVNSLPPTPCEVTK